MSQALDNLRDSVLALPEQDRAQLAEELLESLALEADDDAEFELAMKRDRELETGEVEGISHEDVMRDLRKVIA